PPSTTAAIHSRFPHRRNARNARGTHGINTSTTRKCSQNTTVAAGKSCASGSRSHPSSPHIAAAIATSHVRSPANTSPSLRTHPGYETDSHIRSHQPVIHATAGWKGTSEIHRVVVRARGGPRDNGNDDCCGCR